MVLAILLQAVEPVKPGSLRAIAPVKIGPLLPDGPADITRPAFSYSCRVTRADGRSGELEFAIDGGRGYLIPKGETRKPSSYSDMDLMQGGDAILSTPRRLIVKKDTLALLSSHNSNDMKVRYYTGGLPALAVGQGKFGEPTFSFQFFATGRKDALGLNLDLKEKWDGLAANGFCNFVRVDQQPLTATEVSKELDR